MKLSSFLDRIWRRLNPITVAIAIINGTIIIWRIRSIRGNYLSASGAFLLLFVGVIILPAIIKKMLQSARCVIWDKSPRIADFAETLKKNNLRVQFATNLDSVSYYYIKDNETDEIISRIAVSTRHGIILDVGFKIFADIGGVQVPGVAHVSLKRGRGACFMAADGLIDGDQDIFIEAYHLDTLCNALKLEPEISGVGTTEIRLTHAERVNLDNPAL